MLKMHAAKDFYKKLKLGEQLLMSVFRIQTFLNY